MATAGLLCGYLTLVLPFIVIGTSAYLIREAAQQRRREEMQRDKVFFDNLQREIQEDMRPFRRP